MKKNMLISIVAMFLILSCKPRESMELYGSWRAVHIFFEEKKILDTNIEKNKWFPKYNRTKALYIRENEKVNLYLDRNEDPIIGDFQLLKKDSSLKIYNSSDTRFNGTYHWTMKMDTVMQEGKKVAYYFLTLELEKIKIMAVRNKSLNW